MLTRNDQEAILNYFKYGAVFQFPDGRIMIHRDRARHGTGQWGRIGTNHGWRFVKRSELRSIFGELYAIPASVTNETKQKGVHT